MGTSPLAWLTVSPLMTEAEVLFMILPLVACVGFFMPAQLVPILILKIVDVKPSAMRPRAAGIIAHSGSSARRSSGEQSARETAKVGNLAGLETVDPTAAMPE